MIEIKHQVAVLTMAAVLGGEAETVTGYIQNGVGQHLLNTGRVEMVEVEGERVVRLTDLGREFLKGVLS